MLPTILFIWLPLAVWLWLNVVATIAVSRDLTLEPIQKVVQLAIVWAIPLMGATLFISLSHKHSPESLPRWLIPWPLKSLLLGKPRVRPGYGPDHPGVDLGKFDGSDHMGPI